MIETKSDNGNPAVLAGNLWRVFATRTGKHPCGATETVDIILYCRMEDIARKELANGGKRLEHFVGDHWEVVA